MRLLTRLAACALAAAAFTAPAFAADIGGGYHVMFTPEYKAAHGISNAPNPDASMLYYGGTVFSSSKVVSVIWGNNVNPTTVSTVPGFTGALVDSTFVDQMATQYSTKHQKVVGGGKGSKQTITRGTYLGQVQITPNNKSQSLTDADVQDELKFQIKAGTLPKQDLNTLYMVYFPDNITITLDGLTSCSSFGAYHFAVNDTKETKKNLFYAVEPSCHYSIQNITFAASHEFAEATTDNIPTPGTNPAFPQAWNTSDGYEIADLCGGSGTLTGPNGSYTVTQYFLNSTALCSTGNYTSP